MRRLALQLRSPEGLVFDSEVDAIVAEDRSGWFGIRPGRVDTVAVLPPGLLVFRDAHGEGFVALSQGLLSLDGETCRVLGRDMVLSRTLEVVADQVEAHHARRRARGEARRTVLDQLAREALRRVVREVS